ncbi:MAG: hypothetical protein H0U59_10710 [Gemmatimonadaceae bacterium]|nr:hypothetical protein [Gemmatimonadaceae bacterium]
MNTLPVAPVVCERDTNGRLTCGRLTSDHAASSYGVPVYVREDGAALGAAEVGPLEMVDEVAREPTIAPVLAAARAAGYTITLVTWEQSGRGTV